MNDYYQTYLFIKRSDKNRTFGVYQTGSLVSHGSPRGYGRSRSGDLGADAEGEAGECVGAAHTVGGAVVRHSDVLSNVEHVERHTGTDGEREAGINLEDEMEKKEIL